MGASAPVFVSRETPGLGDQHGRVSGINKAGNGGGYASHRERNARPRDLGSRGGASHVATGRAIKGQERERMAGHGIRLHRCAIRTRGMTCFSFSHVTIITPDFVVINRRMYPEAQCYIWMPEA